MSRNQTAQPDEAEKAARCVDDVERGRDGVGVDGTEVGDGVVDRGGGLEGHHLGVHDAAGGVLGVAQQPAQDTRILAGDVLQHLLRVGNLELADEVSGLIGRHRLRDPRQALRVELLHELGADRHRRVIEHVPAASWSRARGCAGGPRRRAGPASPRCPPANETQEDAERVPPRLAQQRVHLVDERAFAGLLLHQAPGRSVYITRA